MAAPELASRVERLRSSRDVRAVFASRRAVSSDLVVVHARSAGAAAAPRVAVVAGKAVGNAVARNRVKRRLRGLLREVAVPARADYVVVGRAGAGTAPAAVLRQHLQRQLDAAWRRVR